MKRMIQQLMSGLVVLLVSSTVVQADAVDEAISKISAAGDKLTSFTADISMITNMNMGPVSIKGEGKGTLEYLRKADKSMTRMELKSQATQKMGDQEQRMDQYILQVSDGEYSYSLTEQMGMKQAIKTRYDAKNSGVATKEFFDEIRKTHDLKVAEGKHDGQDVYIFTATPKSGTVGMGAGAMSIHVTKESGLTLQLQMMMADSDQPFTTMTFSNIKVGANVSPDRFVFKAPEGVEITDMSNMGNGRPE